MLACLVRTGTRRARRATSLRSDDVDLDDDETSGPVPADLERLVAATFALMTTWYQCPQPAVCHKLLENLARIARHEAVSDGLRRVCTNAGARWAAYLEEVELAIEAGAFGEEDFEEDADADATSSIRPSSGPVTLH
jgi:hypothetical protein